MTRTGSPRADAYSRRHALLVAALCALLPPAQDAFAAGPVAFTTTDQNPFIQIHNLPWPTEPAPPDVGAWSLSFTVDVANNSIAEEGPGDTRIVIDGETWRGGLALAYGVSRRFELGVNVPLVSHQGGIFDGFIRRWHDWFGLSNGRRDAFEDHALEYSYRAGGVDGVRVGGAVSGIGDLRVYGAWRLAGDDPRRRLTLRAGLKLPSGSTSRLLGTGATDLSLELLSTDTRTLAAWHTTLSWSAGVLALGRGDVLADLRRDAVAIGSLGVARPLWRNLSLKAQLDAHGPFYDSGFDILGSGAVQLVVGGGIRIADGTLDIGIVENLFTDTTPDFGVHFAWHTLL